MMSAHGHGRSPPFYTPDPCMTACEHPEHSLTAVSWAASTSIQSAAAREPWTRSESDFRGLNADISMRTDSTQRRETIEVSLTSKAPMRKPRICSHTQLQAKTSSCTTTFPIQPQPILTHLRLRVVGASFTLRRICRRYQEAGGAAKLPVKKPHIHECHGCLTCVLLILV